MCIVFVVFQMQNFKISTKKNKEKTNSRNMRPATSGTHLYNIETQRISGYIVIMSTNTGYTIKTEIFEGPLDLLLQLIEVRKLHINDISLAKITDDYLAHISAIDSFPLKEAAQFILVASTLVLIKSRSLLPSLSLTEEEEGDIKDLERRLREYKRIKELSELIKAQFNKRIMYAPTNIHRIEPVFSPTKKTTKEHLFEIIQLIMRALPKKDMIPQAKIGRAHV